jgi:hypothetical protein
LAHRETCLLNTIKKIHVGDTDDTTNSIHAVKSGAGNGGSHTMWFKSIQKRALPPQSRNSAFCVI